MVTAAAAVIDLAIDASSISCLWRGESAAIYSVHMVTKNQKMRRMTC